MKFGKLVKFMEEIEPLTSHTTLQNKFAKFLKSVPKNDIKQVTHILSGQIIKNFKVQKIGLAEKMVTRAIAFAGGKNKESVTRSFKKRGDLGLVAAKVASGKSARLTVNQVYNQLALITKEAGKGSQENKVAKLAILLKKSSKVEAKYLTRLVLGQLRLGANVMTILDGLAIAYTGTKEHRKTLEQAYNKSPDIGLLAETLAKKGIEHIQKVSVSHGRPIKMMLAQRVKTMGQIKEKMEVIAAEEKYDGERVQIHKTKSGTVLFSRRMENITHQYPDIITYIEKGIKVKDCIIEGEAVAIDKKGNLLPFQKLMQRRRKHNVEEYIKKVPITLFLFELLSLNNKSFIKKPYPERRKALKKITKESLHLQLAKQIVTKDIKQVEKFFHKSLKRKCEGIIAKSCDKDSTYKAGARAWRWIKWKKEYVKGMLDTFDLVIIGAIKGRGKRAGTYGALLCASYNKKTRTYESFCKLGTGFTDKTLKEIPKRLKKYIVKEKPKNVQSKMKPDVWFKPKVVVEVEGAEVTKSPSHLAAGGYALRFPRFLGFRDDKAPSQATSNKEILKMKR